MSASINPVSFKTEVKTEDGKTYAKTTIHDDAALERVKRLKHEAVLDKARLGIHDNADLRMVISCPSIVLWNYFKRDHPKTYSLLNSKDESERMKGAKQVQFIHPEWIIQERL